MQRHLIWTGFLWITLGSTWQVMLMGWADEDVALDKSRTANASKAQHIFSESIQPILARSCIKCHGPETQKAQLRFDSWDALLASQKPKSIITPGQSSQSLLIQRVTSNDPTEQMPPTGPRLSPQEIALLKRWIDHDIKDVRLDSSFSSVSTTDKHWAWQPMQPVPLPSLSPTDQLWVRNPIDQFILHQLRKQGLTPSPEADRRTLLLRLYFDLIGLPPSPEAVARFIADPDPLAYEKEVDRLLASVHYGEKWARHWLDVVHYADTHGYDKDKPRPHAWPYRDYVIRALNEDKPYARFVQEQIAGDALWPNDPRALEATGFLSAGPWDFIGHVELPESKIDGMVARHLDRDDMVSNTIGTFMSLTIHCAQCHNHKFDPITQEDYYRLQAVFAALDRADFAYDEDPHVAAQRAELQKQSRHLALQRDHMLQAIYQRPEGQKLLALDKKRTQVEKQPATLPIQHGYHSALASDDQQVKWVQVDLGQPQVIHEVVLRGCFDDFNQIGLGFGFPKRFKIEASMDQAFQSNVTTIFETSNEPVPNPGTQPKRYAASPITARYVRITALQLAHRHDAYIFALAELEVLDEKQNNLARNAQVTSLDSIEAQPRWSKVNLTDGLYPTPLPSLQDQQQLAEKAYQECWQRMVSKKEIDEFARIKSAEELIKQKLKALPNPKQVYRGCVYHGNGHFRGTGYLDGQPRPIFILNRGDVQKPIRPVEPGAIASIPISNKRFALPAHHTEADRRMALAAWITDPENPLTWRSIVNRIWLHHFGRGIVDTPNDFGRMGQSPTHPELLDWLALHFRDHGQSIKQLHRLIVTSATYRQASLYEGVAMSKDATNQYYWRMNRKRLEAEFIRDRILAVSGKLDLTPFGPAFRDFVVDKSEHSPHYEYDQVDYRQPHLHRRTIYRFTVRSHLHPWLTTFDCADPSISIDKRTISTTPLQALALLNNQLTLQMSKDMAQRVTQMASTPDEQVRQAFILAMCREPSIEEHRSLLEHRQRHGVASMCRVLFNLNEFVYVD